MSLDRAWNILMQMTLLGGAVWLFLVSGLWLLRKAAAAYRHLLLTLLLNALLIFPLLSWLLPQCGVHWNLPYRLPSVSSFRAAKLPGGSSEIRGVSTASSHRDLSASSRHLPFSTHSSPIQAQTPEFIRQAAIRPRPSPAVTLPRPETTFWHRTAFKEAALAVWMSGCAVSLLHLFTGLVRTWRLKSSEISTPDILTSLITQVQMEVGFRRAICVRHGVADRGIAGPLTWGWLHPVLLLPIPFLTWSPERLRLILLHEVAHMQRGDWLFQLLAQLTRSLYWFHPGVWWAVRRLQAESELACDDMVILAGVAPTDYAATLVEVIRTMNRLKTSSSLSASALSMARPPLEARLRAMLAPRSRRRPSRAATLFASSTTLLCVFPLAALHVGAEPVKTTSRILTSLPPISRAASISVSPLLGHGATDRRFVSPQPITSAVSTRQTPRNQEENRRLRQRLDAMEVRLAQNQLENQRLRQQLMALRQQQEANKAKAMQETANAMQAKLRAIQAAQAAGRRNQIAGLQALLQSLKAQQAAMAVRNRQMEQLLKVGNVSQGAVNKARAEMESNQARINAVASKITDLTGGQHVSSREQTRRDLTMQLREIQTLMRAKLAEAALVKARYNAGNASQSELIHAEQVVASLQAQMNEIRSKLQRTDSMR